MALFQAEDALNTKPRMRWLRGSMARRLRPATILSRAILSRLMSNDRGVADVGIVLKGLRSTSVKGRKTVLA
jgi:hypothetical protein